MIVVTKEIAREFRTAAISQIPWVPSESVQVVSRSTFSEERREVKTHVVRAALEAEWGNRNVAARCSQHSGAWTIAKMHAGLKKQERHQYQGKAWFHGSGPGP